MSLFRAIVGGFGFTLGAHAAKAALKEASDSLDDAAIREEERERTHALDAQAASKARELEARQRVKARAAAAREVERELTAMKKKLAREAKKKTSR